MQIRNCRAVFAALGIDWVEVERRPVKIIERKPSQDYVLTAAQKADEKRVERAREILYATVPGVKAGKRRSTAYVAAGVLGDHAVLVDEAIEVIQEWNAAENKPPLGRAEVESTVRGHYVSRNRPFAADYLGDLSAFARKPKTTHPQPSSDVLFENVDTVIEIPADVDRVVEYMEKHYPLEAGEFRVLDLPQGRGKTEYAKRQVEKADAALVLGPRVSLVRNVSARFGITNYQNDKTAEKLATTIHSLRRVQFDNARQDTLGYERDIFVVDEYDKVLDTIVSPRQVKKPIQAKQELFDRMTLSRSGLLMSADNPREYVEYAATAIKARKPDAKVTYFFQKKPRPIHILRRTYKRALAEFYAACKLQAPGDAPLFLFATAKKTPHEIREVVMERHPALRVIAITGENSDTTEVQELLADPNRMAEEYDVVICSPTCGVGMNITTHVKHVFVMHTIRGIVVDDVAQMMGRCRNIETGKVTYGVFNFRPKADAYDDETLTMLSEAYADRTDQLIADVVRRDMVTGRKRIYDDEFLNLWKMKKRREIISANDPHEQIVDVFDHHGWTYSRHITDLRGKDDPDLEILWKKSIIAQGVAKVTRHVNHCHNVSAADEISEEDAKTLEHQYVKTTAEKHSLERKTIEMFYGQEISTELVERDNDGKYRHRCRQYAHSLALEKEGTTFVGTIEHVETDNRHSCQYKHRMLASLLLKGLFNEFFPHEFGNEKNHKFLLHGVQETKERVFAYYQKYASSFDRFFRTKLTEESRAISFFNAMMRRLGAEVHSNHVTTAEGRVRVYHYTFDQVAEDSKAEYKRLDARVRRAIDDFEFAKAFCAA